jgi:uncharacterized protein
MSSHAEGAEPGLRAKEEAVLRRLGRCGDLVVALSGGVDSAVLLDLAARALGPEKVLAVTGVSASLATGELDAARDVARQLGVHHETVETGELDDGAYRANQGDRCFHCRSNLFELIRNIARHRGYAQIAYGAIVDDLGDDRPGMRAADGHGVLAPLLEAGVTKREVRILAARAGLSVQEKPAAACLASRIPVGTEVTREKLAQVDRAEAALRREGFRQLRVRHHGDVARIELDEEGLARLGDRAIRKKVARVVQEAGFRHVAVDLEGYRTGSVSRPAAAAPMLYRIGPARDGGQ